MRMLSGIQHEPNVISFNAAIGALSACEKPLQWQQALGISSAMINACETGEQWQHEDAVGNSARA